MSHNTPDLILRSKGVSLQKMTKYISKKSLNVAGLEVSKHLLQVTEHIQSRLRVG